MKGKKTMTLLNVAYAPKCDSNLIPLGQLYKSRVLYHDHPNFIIFKKEDSIVGIANK